MANHSALAIADSVRYVDTSHWTCFRNNGQECRDLIQESYNSKPFPPDENRRLAIFERLVGLPGRSVTDVFVDSFFLAVQPVFPIVLSDEFNAQYANIFDMDFDLQTELIIDKVPTYLCVLWAVMYCGAVVTPSESWTRLALNMDKNKMIKQLEEGYQCAVEFCKRESVYPTEYTLAASLLHHCAGHKNTGAIERLTFIAQAVREAVSRSTPG